MLVCGMSPREYWYEDVLLAKAYMRAWEQKVEDQWYRDWLMGQYFAAAIACSFSKDASYPEEPFPVTAKREADEDALKAKRTADGVSHMESFMAMFNATRQKKAEAEPLGEVCAS